MPVPVEEHSGVLHARHAAERLPAEPVCDTPLAAGRMAVGDAHDRAVLGAHSQRLQVGRWGQEADALIGGAPLYGRLNVRLDQEPVVVCGDVRREGRASL